MSEFCHFAGDSVRQDDNREGSSGQDDLKVVKSSGFPAINSFNVAHFSIENELYPLCCQTQQLPAHRRLRDATVTSAPMKSKTLPTKQGNYDHQSGRNGNKTFTRNVQEQVNYTRPNIRTGFQLPPMPVPIQTHSHPSGYELYSNSRMPVPTEYRMPMPTEYRIPQRTDQQMTQRENIRQYPQPVRTSANATRNITPAVSYPRDPNIPPSSTFNATKNVIRAVQQMKRPQNETFSRPLGFQEFTQTIPSANFTYSVNSPTYTSTYTSSEFPTGSDHYPDLGPWRNFEIPKKLKKVNIAPMAHKTFPRVPIPLPSRNYSTYDDPQPIMNLKEVAEHRKKAPRFFSTPTSYGFKNEGISASTVWGNDPHDSRLASNYYDSSSGWSQGVRMDTFNVRKQMTPSPKNIPVPRRAQMTIGPPIPNVNRMSPLHKTHTYLQNPYPEIKYIPDAPAEGSRRGETRHYGRRTSPQRNQLSKTFDVPAPADDFCAPCAPKETSSVEKCEPCRKDEEEEKKDDGFCTVLEIRTPCEENPCVPGKPLQLSIHVSCAEPSTLVTPDKRFHVLPPPPPPPPPPPSPPPPVNASYGMDDVPSDCECE